MDSEQHIVALMAQLAEVADFRELD